jgi:hypothetical protein
MCDVCKMVRCVCRLCSIAWQTWGIYSPCMLSGMRAQHQRLCRHLLWKARLHRTKPCLLLLCSQSHLPCSRGLRLLIWGTSYRRAVIRCAYVPRMRLRRWQPSSQCERAAMVFITETMGRVSRYNAPCSLLSLLAVALHFNVGGMTAFVSAIAERIRSACP